MTLPRTRQALPAHLLGLVLLLTGLAIVPGLSPTASTQTSPGADLAPASTSVARTSVIRNGTFAAGMRSWRSHGGVTIRRNGLTGSHAANLAVRPARHSGLTDNPDSATGVKAGDRYHISAWVRTSRAGKRLVLQARHVVQGRGVESRSYDYRSTSRRWRKLSFIFTPRRSGGSIDLSTTAFRSTRRAIVQLDNVSIVRERTVSRVPAAPAVPAGPAFVAPTTPLPPRPTAACGAQGKYAPACGALWGVYRTATAAQGWDHAKRITDLEAQVGRRFDLTLRYHDFSTHPTLGVFPDQHERALGASRTLVFSWQARVGSTNTDLRWQAIADGQYDSFIDSAASRIRAYGRPTIIAFDAEFDNLTRTKGTPEEYAAAYRRIVDRFRAAGVTNVAWAWVPTGYLGAGRNEITKRAYPGDSYVDWVGYDPYNFYRCNGTSWKNFEQTVAPAYNWLMENGFGDKPFLISEYGTQYDPAYPQRSTDWHAQIPMVLPKYPNLKGLVRFDSDGVFTNTGARCNMWLENGAGMMSSYAWTGKAPNLNVAD